MDYREKKLNPDFAEILDGPADKPPALKDHSQNGKESVLNKKQLINRLNHLNFQNQYIHVNFKHPKYQRRAHLSAKPQPCSGNTLVCLWNDEENIDHVLDNFEFDEVLIASNNTVLSLKDKPIGVSRKGFSVALPESCVEKTLRHSKRRKAELLRVQLLQNSAAFDGDLVDFSAASFCVEASVTPPQTFQWINPKARINVILSDQTETLYSGECRILKQTDSFEQRQFVLEPLNQVVQRFKPKEYRSNRLQLKPSPDMVFRHPLTNNLVSLKVIDLSGSGFSVEDDLEDGSLIAGLIIPRLELDFANTFKLVCKAQVVYRKLQNEDSDTPWIKCGLALLDMDLEDHRRLMALLHQAENKHAYVCNKVDLDDLWHFFFETGFIYPKKYAFIEANKEKIKDTYEKLYTRSTTIARHFIYQDKGTIKGHMSMLRFYQNTWMIHHHAALKTDLVSAGLAVLDQIGRFTYDSYRLYSSHMNYLICYFRPENQFPHAFFGGAVQSINYPKVCSLDTFAYTHFRKLPKTDAQLPRPWELNKCTPNDLRELELFYNQEAGGVMIQALDLLPEGADRFELSEEFKRYGFKRERRLFSIKKGKLLMAVIMVNVSDIALNMSDLTNCTTIFVLEPDDLPCEILNHTLSMISDFFEQKKFPLLFYPVAYAEKQSIRFEKVYNLWSLCMQASDEYFDHIHQLLSSHRK